MKTIQGTIAAIQEGRFRLVSPAGQGYLLTLAKQVSTSARELDTWRRAKTLVEVRYAGQPNLESGVAWHIRPV
jgi:hypothetical protein